MHMCVSECVIFFHHSVWEVKSVDLFYSFILSLWYVGYDDIISMNNVFVLTIIIIIIISLFVLSLAYMKINILEKSLYLISHQFFCLCFFSYFFIFCISSIYRSLINFSFLFLSSSVFIFSLILFLFLYFTLSVCCFFF